MVLIMQEPRTGFQHLLVRWSNFFNPRVDEYDFPSLALLAGAEIRLALKAMRSHRLWDLQVVEVKVQLSQTLPKTILASVCEF